MSLTPGVQFGPYEILAAAGAGGMGEVYKARDTRLDRSVAVKILPAADPDRRARFEREAKSIAALSHPHICTLHDVGQHGGIDYLVMEFVDGVTLATRVSTGALPVDEALRLAIEVASALDHAHRHGIVHRDLKPGNIMLTRPGKTTSGASHAKLLDFGLAKVMAADAGAVGRSVDATRSAPLTTEGSVLGTLQYMSPEQIEGVGVDARTDLFAFGAVLYEMLTGRRAFTGTTQAGLIGAILRDDPAPVSTQQPRVSAALDRIVARCLAKDPEDRWQTARDLLAELEWVADARLVEPHVTTGPRPRDRRRAAAVIASVAIAASAVLFYAGSRPNRPTSTVAPVERLTIVPPRDRGAGINPAQRMALSPDGRHLAYVTTNADGRGQLWVRALDELAPRPLDGATGPRAPFWSPDGRFVAFQSVADNKIKKIAVDGGPAIPVCDLPSGLTAVYAAGGAWGADGVILFAVFLPTARIYMVPAEGGVATALAVDTANGELGQAYPSFLPDGRHYVYLSLGANNAQRGTWLSSLDSQDRTLILPNASNTAYAIDHLVYTQGNLLMAQPFDLRTRTATGSATPIAGPLQLGGITGRTAGFAVSSAGSLAYVGLPPRPDSRLAWFSRAGGEIGSLGAAGFDDLELSPDKRRALVSIFDADTGTRDLWVVDTASQARTRLTSSPEDEGPGVWAPDGLRVVYPTTRKDRAQSSRDLLMRSVSGGGETLLAERMDFRPGSWSSDGGLIVYGDVLTGSTWTTRPEPGAEPSRYGEANGPQGQNGGRLSPDARWIASSSSDSGRSEVYVSAFPNPQGRRQVSTAGGTLPRWRSDGRELFFVAQDQLMAAPVTIGAGRIEVGAPQPLFTIQPRGDGGYNYDVDADGQRFLLNVRDNQIEPATVTLLNNWRSLLSR